MTGTSVSTSIMGRSAVLVLATLLAVGGVMQLFGVNVSRAIESVEGGRIVDTAWSLTLVLAFALIAASTVCDMIGGCDEASVHLEVVGAAILIAGVLVYMASVITTSGMDGNYILLGFCSSTVINIGGREVLLVWRARGLMQEANGGDE